MAHILNRTFKAFVILLSSMLAALALSGCSESPRQQANQSIESANEEISAHDELYEEARALYEDSQNSAQEEDGESTTQGQSTRAQSISEARRTMQQARGQLQQAREEISSIRDLDVSAELLEYSRALDGALEAQIRAEQREIDFYEIAEQDPALEDDRERAIGILAEAEDAYEEAEEGYERAAEIGDSTPQMAAPQSD